MHKPVAARRWLSRTSPAARYLSGPSVRGGNATGQMCVPPWHQNLQSAGGQCCMEGFDPGAWHSGNANALKTMHLCEHL